MSAGQFYRVVHIERHGATGMYRARPEHDGYFIPVAADTYTGIRELISAVLNDGPTAVGYSE